MEYGLWDQIRVDHGKEWCLMLYINGTLSHLRGNTAKVPHLQTSSTKVHTIISLSLMYREGGREGIRGDGRENLYVYNVEREGKDKWESEERKWEKYRVQRVERGRGRGGREGGREGRRESHITCIVQH